MDSERWKKIEDIFQDALDLSGEARKNFINEKTVDDAELRAEVEKLVARFEVEDEFLESPVWTDSVILGNTLKNRVASSLENEIPPESSEKSFTGKRVGVYRLTDQIGKGGMGVVHAAERADGEFHQKVAVKLIKRGMDTDFIISRFRHERQILANLNHPNIARLLDGGTTDDDLPYFVMEYIEGKPLLKYSEEKNLDLRQKLKLFLQVCAPIIYAHKRKIIHRDIKPSNILVNEDGEPKLLDFGIAKLLDTDSIHESFLPTATAMRLMTPEYASPEQVRGEEITPTSDQYSLGVLLYELITGARPYKFPSRSPHEIARVICEEIPSEPSSGSFGKLTTGNIDVQFDEEFCKKLDRIVLKTLRKNPAERYESVEEFANDIERFLRNENVRAELFAKESAQLEISSEKENVRDTEDFAKTTKGNINGEKIKKKPREKPISPRWRGIKQGIFISVLSIVSIPVLVLITVTGILPPQVLITAFVLFFLSGFVRMIYALLFESGKKESEFSSQNETEIAEAETKLINSSAPRNTIIGNVHNAEKTVEREKSVAVLPFKNLNPSTGEQTDESEFLNIGLADALITRLSNVRQLVVRPTNSVLRFASENTDAFAAGEELKVEYILTGNILRANKKIRVSIQLLDVEKETTVWAERFDEDFTDVLEIEDSITAKVVEALVPKLTGKERRQIEKRGTENAEAHEAYLRGRSYWNSFTEEGFRQAKFYFEKAIELDPNYALAYTGLTDYYLWLGAYAMKPPKECFPPARKAAEKAVALDNESAEAHSAFGFAQLCNTYDWEKSEKSALRAIELNPNYISTYIWYASHLFSCEKFEEGLQIIHRAIKLDPLSFQSHNSLAYGLYFARRYDEAIAKAEDNVKRFPAFSLSYNALSLFLRRVGRGAESLEAANRAVELSTNLDRMPTLFIKVSALAAANKKREAENLLREIESKYSDRYISPREYVNVYCYLGEKEKALDALERSVADGELLIWVNCEPSLDIIHDDPRYQKLLEKINYPRIEKVDSYASGEVEPRKITRDFQKKKSGFPSALKYVLSGAVVIGFGFLIYNFITHSDFNSSDSNINFKTSNISPEERWKNNFTSRMNVRRLTASGIVRRAVTSPDGKRIGYISSNDQTQSLRIRDVESETERELIAPAAVLYLEFKFSSDGKYIYYLTDIAAAPRTLYRIPTDGGTSEKISEEIFNSFTLSPDGRRVAYDFSNRQTKKKNILVAELNGIDLQNPQLVAEVTFPDYFIGVFSFSPDGEKLIYGVSKITDNKEVMNIFTYDFETKNEKQLTTKNFSDITGGAWRNGGEEIVVCATEDNSSLYQLWLVSFPSGEVTRLTNDFYDYFGVSLSEDSSSLVTIKKDSTANLWLGELSESGRNFEGKTKQITNKTSRRDGIDGLNRTKDGRIVFVSSINGETGISIINADGTNEETIPIKTTNPSHPSLTPDNRFLIFADQKDQKMSIWRFDTQTRESAEISLRYALTPSISPDGKFIYYSTFSQTNGRMTIHRKPVLGGDETEITDKLTISPFVSPDEKFIACFLTGKETEDTYQIAVFSAESNSKEPLKIIKVFQNGNLENPQMRPLAWSPDGKFLYFVNYTNNVSNIFRVAIEGEQKPVQMTFFTSGNIFDFSLSSDGKGITLSRGTTSSDIVIFKKSQ